MLSKIKAMNSEDLELLCSELELRLSNGLLDEFNKSSLLSLLEYGKLTVLNRAFPRVEDGLKPVHRRTLMSMKDLGLTSTSPFKKSARICGHAIGVYHPHGDASVYDAMVRLAQPFSMRAKLVEGQGNFGSIEGDSAASSRYTEATVSKVGEAFFKDLDKEVVPFKDNYDETTKEPVVLPVRFPHLLINGTQGIAVGMASKIPPHNPQEIIDACIYLIESKKKEFDLDVFCSFIKGPDFPTGGIMYDVNIKDIVLNGNSKLKLRAKHHIEKNARRESIVITEIPYLVGLNTIFNKLQEVSNNKKEVSDFEIFKKSISGIRNESGKDSLRIVIDLKTGVDANLIWNRLLKVCPLDETISYINNVIDIDGMPKMMGILDILESFISFRRSVLNNKYSFIKKESEDKLEIVEGFLKALSMLDLIIKIIREADNEDIAIEKISELGFTKRQVKAIVFLRLGRLTKLEGITLEKEKMSLEKTIDKCMKIIASDTLKYNEMIDDLVDSKSIFDLERKTILEDIKEELDYFREESVVYISKIGYLKKELLKKDKEPELSENDEVLHRLECCSLDVLYVVCKSGMVYGIKVADIDKIHISSVIGKETVVSYVIGDGNLVMVSSSGLIKKSSMKDYSGATRAGGIVGMKSDDIVFAGIINEGFIALYNSIGKVIKFDISEVPVQGRTSQGVIGIKGGSVIGASVGDVIIGKEKVIFDELSIQKRGGIGNFFKKGSYSREDFKQNA